MLSFEQFSCFLVGCTQRPLDLRASHLALHSHAFGRWQVQTVREEGSGVRSHEAPFDVGVLVLTVQGVG